MMVLRRIPPSIFFLLLALSHSARAFIPSVLMRGHVSTATRLHLMDFLNEGKKALVRSLAGDYDREAVRARLDTLIRESPVLMLTFET
jgi:hypothetical protein